MRHLSLIVLTAALLTAASPAAFLAQSPQAARAVTFTEHIAPILFKNCTSCHRPGQAAPFALMSYEDARPRARQIVNVTRSRQMPPWKADGDYAFEGDRRLPDDQIELIERWVDGGMVEGDARALPKVPPAPREWPLGKPDLIVTAREAFTVPGSGRDVYRNFVLPLNLKDDKWVKAVDVKPSAPRVVHHVIVFSDPTHDGRLQDEQDPGPGFGGVMSAVGNGAGRGTLADYLTQLSQPQTARGGRGAPGQPQTQSGRGGGAIGGYVPGARAHLLPDELAAFLPRQSNLIVSTHFHSSGQEERETSQVGLYFTSKAPTRGWAGISLPPHSGVFKGINILPGDSAYTITDSFVLPIEVTAFAVGGHAHYLARTMTMKATLPNGTTKTLLSIADWDLSWQERYFFKDAVVLPAGTRLDSTIRYDNSAANRRNPFNPPQRVTFGEQSTNEMGSVTLSVMPAQRGTIPILQQAVQEHDRAQAMASPVMQQFQQRGGAQGRRGR